MRSIESTGKTVEEAVQTGLAKLSLELSDVTFEVLNEGSKGFFGLFGAKPAKVRITERERTPEFDIDQILHPDTLERASGIATAPQPPCPEQSQPAAKPEPAPRPVRTPAKAKAPSPRPAHVEPELAKVPEGPLPAQDLAALSEAGRSAYDYLETLTQLMGVPVKIYVAENETSLSISMMGDTLGILIGRRGDTLDALQYLTSLEVNKERDEYLRVSLDTENYRAKREDSLKRLAERMAARAVKTGHKVVLEPMNPYERRVLHSSLQNHPYVQTHSEGDEPNRRVVITLRPDAPQPEVSADKRPSRRERKPADRPAREEHSGGEGRPAARRPRPPRPPKPALKAPAENGRPESTPLAQNVPADPTDDTI